MDMRVTPQTNLQRALSGTRQLTDQLANLQMQSTTGKKYANVSDNPSAVLAVLSNTTQEQRLSAYLENINSVRSTLDFGVSTLQQVGTVFTQARSIALEASNSVNDASSFETMARQVDSLIESLLGLANTKNNETYLFGGAGATTQPFAVTNQNALGQPLEVSYQADTNFTFAKVDRNQQVAIYYPGNEVFMARDRQATTFTGNTGAKPGVGTDTDVTMRDLVLTHTSTTFAPDSGIANGSSSLTGDTVLGPAGLHRLHITDTSGTGAAGTITLDGGPAYNFTNADTNLRVTNNNGDVIFLNTTAITANFNGDVDITADGTLSIDGGATTTPITFSASQMITNSASGKVTFVDTASVKRTGREVVEYPGTYDAFQSLVALRDSLRNTSNLSQTDQIAAISKHIGELERVHNRILDTVGAQSASLSSLESLQTHLEDLKLNAQKTASDIGNADIADIVVKLQSYEQMLQLTLAAYARITSQSLLDFLS